MTSFRTSLLPAMLLALGALPATSQDAPAPEAQEPATSLSADRIERQVFEQDGDLVLYLRIENLELTVGELVVALEVQDLPALRTLLSNLSETGGEDGGGDDGG